MPHPSPGKAGIPGPLPARITYGPCQNPSNRSFSLLRKRRPRVLPTLSTRYLTLLTDRMHGLLMERADALMGCLEGSAEDAELAMLTDIIEAYERQRWPDGRIPGGKG